MNNYMHNRQSEGIDLTFQPREEAKLKRRSISQENYRRDLATLEIEQKEEEEKKMAYIQPLLIENSDQGHVKHTPSSSQKIAQMIGLKYPLKMKFGQK